MQIDKKDFFFTFQTYKTLKTRKNLSSKLLIINNNSIEEIRREKNFNQRKISKKVLINILNVSVFKNFKNIVNGNVFFIKQDKNGEGFKSTNLKKKTFADFRDILSVKLNKKLYPLKLILNSNFLTYQENLMLFFQLKLIYTKKIIQTEESRI